MGDEGTNKLLWYTNLTISASFFKKKHIFVPFRACWSGISQSRSKNIFLCIICIGNRMVFVQLERKKKTRTSEFFKTERDTMLLPINDLHDGSNSAKKDLIQGRKKVIKTSRIP